MMRIESKVEAFLSNSFNVEASPHTLPPRGARVDGEYLVPALTLVTSGVMPPHAPMQTVIENDARFQARLRANAQALDNALGILGEQRKTEKKQAAYRKGQETKARKAAELAKHEQRIATCTAEVACHLGNLVGIKARMEQLIEITHNSRKYDARDRFHALADFNRLKNESALIHRSWTEANTELDMLTQSK